MVREEIGGSIRKKGLEGIKKTATKTWYKRRNRKKYCTRVVPIAKFVLIVLSVFYSLPVYPSAPFLSPSLSCAGIMFFVQGLGLKAIYFHVERKDLKYTLDA